MGAFYYFLIPLYLFIHIQGEIITEKEQKILQGLQVFGVSQKSFFLSWFITAFLLSFLLSFLQVFFSIIFKFQFFQQTPFIISFALFFNFCISMQALGLFLQSITKTKTENYLLSFAFVLFSVVIELFISQKSLVLPYIYGIKRSFWTQIATWVLYLYSPFNYNVSFMLISLKAGYHFDDLTNRWQEGTGFYWKDLFEEFEGEINGEKFKGPSVFKMIFLLQFLSFIFYVFLAIFFDEDNLGLFLKKESQELQIQQEKKKDNQNIQQNNQVKGIQIKNISKTYINKKKKNTALKNITLEIQQNELMCILGHNGAGKTTLINILSGLQKYTSGKINICGYDINTQIQEIRENLGVCPQFDVLWDQLSPLEHLMIFGFIKNIQNLENVAWQTLKKVSLEKQAHVQSKTLSGGMKRRLSIAICSQGQPKVIFLDEPTTGMDTKIRREVWKLIQEIKEGKSIILTTHSMEEAQVLSDRISILVQGELKCIGTGLNLRNEYGGGYKVQIVMKDQIICKNNIKSDTLKTIQTQNNDDDEEQEIKYIF
ncbi:hypothetical protein IMG5_034790 [Ichthyophthirius multifiliis]|uniref:ABC transporter domain-containing protein n=1 Tax=Ichthyophthirius multifiliis TaxID=5932 RepID=G0QLQ1_ICHMU|nr:hypothetical protein IMG5_034790 [Ichthyophthirius multifiliis]EGR33847.1 hypothetical protein IMG5_034790 [Ichthyophthirius multifiliis]|eukprot:XP_004039071.1 hypothetical protein IMG5_034790 [Ichthyophthirius multifiliis]